MSLLQPLFFTILITWSQAQNLHTNTIDDPNPFAEMTNAFLQGGNTPDIGGFVSTLLESKEGKQLGGMLVNAAMNSGGAGNILSGLGAMLGDKQGGGGGGGIDPSMISNIIGVLAESSGQKHTDGDNMGDLINIATNAFQNSGITTQNFMEYLPQIVSTVNAFVGPEAKEREKHHQEHAWMMPPIVEKAHILFDHFSHSELGRSLWRLIGADSFFQKFSRDGRFDFNKFFDMLENQNFRRHWIKLWTKKITDIIAVLADPKIHKRYLDTGIHILNGFMKTVGFPKAAMIDLNRPHQTIASAMDYFFKTFLDMKVDSMQFVKPGVNYFADVVNMVRQRGILQDEGIDSHALSNKLTDTLNLEVIEPLARVYRAYRFAKKVPECDKYVMCLLNQEDPNEEVSLPGLKKYLTKAASIYVSWFLSGKTGTSFWTLYSQIMDEKDCSIRFVEKCNDFHIEEIKVTTEYVHNEL